jgi:hypothetical protein
MIVINYRNLVIEGHMLSFQGRDRNNLDRNDAKAYYGSPPPALSKPDQ